MAFHFRGSGFPGYRMCDLGGTQTHDLLNRNQTLYSTKLRDQDIHTLLYICKISSIYAIADTFAKLLILFEITKYLSKKLI